MRNTITRFLCVSLLLFLCSFNVFGQPPSDADRLVRLESEMNSKNVEIQKLNDSLQKINIKTIEAANKAENARDSLSLSISILSWSIPTWLLLITGVVLSEFFTAQRRAKKAVKEELKNMQKAFDNMIIDHNKQLKEKTDGLDKIMERLNRILANIKDK